MTDRAELKRRARASLKGNYGVVVGTTLLSTVILGICSGVIRLISMVIGLLSSANTAVFGGGRLSSGIALTGVVSVSAIPNILFVILANLVYVGFAYILLAGGIKIYMKLCEGQKAEIGDLFWGFKNQPLRFAGIGALIMAVIFLCLLPVIVLMIAMAITGDGRFALGFISIYGLVLAVIAIYLCLTFGMFLYIMVDRPELTVLETLTESRKLMKGNRIRLVVLELSFIGWGLLAMLSLGIGSLWLNGYIMCTTVWFYKNLYPQIETIPPEREYAADSEAQVVSEAEMVSAQETVESSETAETNETVETNEAAETSEITEPSESIEEK